METIILIYSIIITIFCVVMVIKYKRLRKHFSSITSSSFELVAILIETKEKLSAEREELIKYKKHFIAPDLKKEFEEYKKLHDGYTLTNHKEYWKNFIKDINYYDRCTVLSMISWFGKMDKFKAFIMALKNINLSKIATHMKECNWSYGDNTETPTEYELFDVVLNLGLEYSTGGFIVTEKDNQIFIIFEGKNGFKEQSSYPIIES